MKLQIEIVGLQYVADTLASAIHSAANKICSALTKDSSGTTIAGIPLSPDNKPMPVVRKRIRHDGQRGCYWIYRNYGYTQAQTTRIAKMYGIQNLGTVSNPRYSFDDIAKIISALDKQQKKQ